MTLKNYKHDENLIKYLKKDDAEIPKSDLDIWDPKRFDKQILEREKNS